MIWDWVRGILLSKTFWFNALALAVVIAGDYGYTGELPVSWEAALPAIIAIVNLLLRLVTRTAIPNKRELFG